jgi:hypothetical protein
MKDLQLLLFALDSAEALNRHPVPTSFFSGLRDVREGRTTEIGDEDLFPRDPRDNDESDLDEEREDDDAFGLNYNDFGNN